MTDNNDDTAADIAERIAKLARGEFGNKPSYAMFRYMLGPEAHVRLSDEEIYDLWKQAVNPEPTKANLAAVDQAMAWLDRQKVHPLKKREVDSEGFHPKESAPKPSERDGFMGMYEKAMHATGSIVRRKKKRKGRRR